MSTHTSFSIDDYELFSTPGYADSCAMTIFTEKDKIFWRSNDDGERTPIRVVDMEESIKSKLLDLIEDSEEENELNYLVPGWVARDRLNVMGFTLDTTKEIFNSGVKSRLLELKEWNDTRDDDLKLWDEEITFLEKLTFDLWLAEFRTLVESGFRSYDLKISNRASELSDFAKHVLAEYNETLLGFPISYDIRYFIRAAIEACGPNAILEQNLTGVINAGYYEIDEPITDNAREGLLYDFQVNAKIVVLTEGITDKKILEESLRLLYPHLADYYSFMDFDEAKVPGGAGYLANTLKAFIGAGIANKIVALFDNDTAAKDAMNLLTKIKIPPHVKVLQYPSIPLASSYPAIGPNGNMIMDVNGHAGCLELYFGEDILRDNDGEFKPIRWTSFNKTIGQYQGELSDKQNVQKAMENKLKNAKTNRELVKTQDWTGIRAILDSLRNAFDNEKL